MKIDINSLFPNLQQVYPQKPPSKNDSHFDCIKMASLMNSPENEEDYCLDDNADMSLNFNF